MNMSFLTLLQAVRSACILFCSVYGAANLHAAVCPAPELSLKHGTYPGNISVELTNTEPGSTIYYNLNGIPPISSWTAYTGPLLITASATVHAMSTKAGFTNSETVSEKYIIDIASAALPRNGLKLWLDASTLSLNHLDPVNIWPDQSGNAHDLNTTTSPTLSLFSPGGGTVFFDSSDEMTVNRTSDLGSTQVTLIALFNTFERDLGDPGPFAIPPPICSLLSTEAYSLRVHYNGEWRSFFSTPPNTRYIATPYVHAAILGHLPGYPQSSVSGGSLITLTGQQGAYTLFEKLNYIGGGTSSNPQAIANTSLTINGTPFDASGSGLGNPIGNTAFSQILIYDRALSRAEREAALVYLANQYQISLKTATPSINSTSNQAEPRIVTISNPDGYPAEIRYTLTGETPTASSQLYYGPLTITQTTTVKARAYRAEFGWSEIASENISVAQLLTPPISNKSTGIYSAPQQVSLTTTSQTYSPEIRYTLDGSTPNASSTLYTTPLNVTQTTRVRAITMKAGFVSSSISAVKIIIDPHFALIPTNGRKVWLRPDSAEVNDTENVATWPDRSGGNNHAAQSNPSYQPRYFNNGLNGKPIIRFSSPSAQHLTIPEIADLNPTTQLTLVALAKRTTGTGIATSAMMIAEKGITSTDTNRGYSLRYPTTTTAGGYINSNGTTFAAPADAFALITQVYNSINNRLFVNGLLGDTNAYTSAISPRAVPLSIGARLAASSLAPANCLNGDIAFLLFYNRALEEWELERINEYAYITYHIGKKPTLPPPTFTPESGVYPSSRTLTINGYNGASIRYTLDGSEPTATSPLYSGAITISSTTTVKAYAFHTLYHDSTVSSARLIINTPLTAADGLPASYSSDINGNGVPDSAEIALGLDPANPNTVNGTAQNFDYDQLNRLDTGPEGKFTQDAEGNIKSK